MKKIKKYSMITKVQKIGSRTTYLFILGGIMLAYGYCRFSSDLQNEASIEQQKEELEEYAKRNNIEIVKYYCDEAKSGKKSSRENFQLMCKDACKNKNIGAVLVWKTDRFARNTIDSLIYREKLKKHGVQLISITQPIDDNTPEGKLMSILLAGMDEYYIRNLASNVNRALKANAKDSLFNGGIPPLGYDIVDKKYVINENEAKIVRKIFDLRYKGYSLTEIINELNKLNYKTKRKKDFKINSLIDLLKNEKYIGTYTYNKGTSDNHREVREDIIRKENAIPAIIEKEVFDKVNEKKEKKESTASKNFYLLTGLIVCPECGAKYCGTTNPRIKNGKKYTYRYYKCINRNSKSKCTSPLIRQEVLEQEVIKLLTEKLLNIKTIEEIVTRIDKEYKSTQKDFTEDVETLEKQLKEIKEQIDNLINMAMNGIATNSIKEKMLDLEGRKEIIEEELEYKKRIAETDYITPERIRDAIKSDVLDFDIQSKYKLKRLIQKWVKKIELTTDEIRIYLNFSDNESENLVARGRFELSTHWV